MTHGRYPDMGFNATSTVLLVVQVLGAQPAGSCLHHTGAGGSPAAGGQILLSGPVCTALRCSL
jgi:hypothetical protein